MVQKQNASETVAHQNSSLGYRPNLHYFDYVKLQLHGSGWGS